MAKCSVKGSNSFQEKHQEHRQHKTCLEMSPLSGGIPLRRCPYTARSYLLIKPTAALTKGHCSPFCVTGVLHNPQHQLAAVALMDVC